MIHAKQGVTVTSVTEILKVLIFMIYRRKIVAEFMYMMKLVNILQIAIIFTALNSQFLVVETTVIAQNEGIQDSQGSMCLTANCIKQAAFFLNNMDQNVDPCVDFYKYTCGNFIKKTFIPQGKRVVGPFTSITDGINNDLLDGLQTEILSDDLDAFKKMKIHYQNCANESRIEEAGLEPYLNILKKIGGWPVLMGDSWNEEMYTWEGTFVKLHFLGIAPGFPFYLSIRVDSKNETTNIFHLYPAMTMIYNETKLYSENNKTLDAYYDFMLDIAVMLGANKSTVHQELRDCLEFEIDLLKIETPHNKIDENSTNQEKTILELSSSFPSIHWFELFSNILSLGNATINETDVIEVFDMNYVNKLEILINKTPKRVQANYQIWQVIYALIGLMPKKCLVRRTIYHSVAYEDSITDPLNREMYCLSVVKRSLHIAINGLYVRKYFDHDVKKRITQMTSDIKNQFIENFQKSWRSHENTTDEILQKVNTMNMSIAYPEELLDDNKIEEYYKNLDIEPGLYINSALNVSLFRFKQVYENYQKPIEKNNWVWHAYVAFVNAYYSSENFIGLPAGILHEPFIYIQGPEYLNYGAIGSIIAHEITHGIYRGIKKQIVNDTTSTNNETDIKNINQCFIDKYNNYTVSEGFAVNGSRTLSENIPDITGFKIAYQAYNEWIKRNDVTELYLPGFDHNPLQMFWISAASTHCRKYKTKYLQKQVQWDPHSPTEARINVAFSNIDEFAKDFKCKEGLKMNPVKKCDLW